MLSDNTLNVNDKGAPQTLYNIFSFVAPADILCVTSATNFKNNKPSEPFTSRYITYGFNFFTLPQNRFTRVIKNIGKKMNYIFSFYLSSFNQLKKEIENFGADVIVLSFTGADTVFMYEKLKPVFKNKKVFSYLMDDWMIHDKTRWPGGNVHSVMKEILTTHDSWMMISKNLSDILSERYGAKPVRLLEIHNPVLLAQDPVLPDYRSKNEYIIAYAGSLWPMHYDALQAVAKAVEMLQSKRKIKLIIYTTESHWSWRKNELDFKGVEYGGNIAYRYIHEKLADADCLLITSSFSQEWITHTKGSVQTKITDYMKAARLIIGCGPSYAANHEFIKKYNCGICIETNDPKKIAYEIEMILDNIESNLQYVVNGVEALRCYFSFEKVHEKLKAFLAA